MILNGNINQKYPLIDECIKEIIIDYFICIFSKFLSSNNLISR